MKKLICKWQDTMLNTETNTYQSRCVCEACEWCFDAATEARCLSCPNRVSPDEGDNEALDSMTGILDVKVDERSDEEVQLIYDKHCKKCDQYTKAGDICQSATCGCFAVVGDIVKSSGGHCPDGKW